MGHTSVLMVVLVRAQSAMMAAAAREVDGFLEDDADDGIGTRPRHRQCSISILDAPRICMGHLE
eukprot:COSAG05_NODE_1654_length_4332_cov_9.405150_1_plen_64_part_00